MNTLLKGETGNKSTTANVDTEIVTCVHTTVHQSISKDERFQMTWLLFFGDMTEAQILEAAAEHFVIKIRRSMAKVAKPTNDDWNNVTFNVKEYITSRVSHVDKMAAKFAGFTDAQKEELLETLNLMTLDSNDDSDA